MTQDCEFRSESMVALLKKERLGRSSDLKVCVLIEERAYLLRAPTDTGVALHEHRNERAFEYSVPRIKRYQLVDLNALCECVR